MEDLNSDTFLTLVVLTKITSLKRLSLLTILHFLTKETPNPNRHKHWADHYNLSLVII